MGLTPLEGIIMGTLLRIHRSCDHSAAYGEGAPLSQGDRHDYEQEIRYPRSIPGRRAITAISKTARRRATRDISLSSPCSAISFQAHRRICRCNGRSRRSRICRRYRGEQSPLPYEGCTDNLAFLGCKIDEEKNKLRGEELDISAPRRKAQNACYPHKRRAHDRKGYIRTCYGNE